MAGGADTGPQTAQLQAMFRTYRGCKGDHSPQTPTPTPSHLPSPTHLARRHAAPSTHHTHHKHDGHTTRQSQRRAPVFIFYRQAHAKGAARCPASSAIRTFDSSRLHDPGTDLCGLKRPAPPTCRTSPIHDGRVGSLLCHHDRLTFPLTYGPARDSAGTNAPPSLCEGLHDAGGSSAERRGKCAGRQ